MKLCCLVENSCAAGLGCAHGLSLYAEAAGKKILFDAGPDGALLMDNAKKLGVELAEVDIAVLSHGHYDHAGGLRAFLELNRSATVYIHKYAATRGHYATEDVGWRFIGLDEDIVRDFGSRIVLTEGCCEISPGLTLFSDISTEHLLSSSNSSLFEEQEGSYVPDPFRHEQNLLINENGKLHLLAGCAHRGIVNILLRASEIGGRAPDTVFSGFHLTNPGLKKDLPDDQVRAVGAELKNFPSVYYTGHCTGVNPFAVLKEELGEQLYYLSGGLKVEL